MSIGEPDEFLEVHQKDKHGSVKKKLHKHLQFSLSHGKLICPAVHSWVLSFSYLEKCASKNFCRTHEQKSLNNK